MRYNKSARLDTSGVRDARRSSGRLGGRSGIAVGGGGVGVVGVLIYLLVAVIGGGRDGASAVTDVLGQLGHNGSAATADNSELKKECQTGQDANTKLDCAVVADIDSVQDFWSKELPKHGATYTDVPTLWFTGQVSTGCGTADSGAGPFYCPADSQVYIDLSFYNDLTTQFGAEGGLFVDAYVIAHEYGHHVQDLLGTSDRVHGSASGPTSASVRLELQADCYAGLWAKHATTTPGADGKILVTEITADDISRALDTAGRIGDDYIQTHLGRGSVDRSKFTHGTSAQRRHWFTTGYESGQFSKCDTFGATSLG